MNSKELKINKEEKLEILEIKFRYWMGIAEVFAPIFIQSIPAALTLVSIGVLFPALLHIDPWLAWSIAAFVAIGMELLGLVSVDVYFASKTFNQTRKNDEGKAPEGAALLVMMVYAVTALLIVVLLKMFPSLAIWSLIPLTLMSILIVSAVTMKKRLSELISVRDKEVAKKELQEVADSMLQKLQQKVAEEELHNKKLQEIVANQKLQIEKLQEEVAQTKKLQQEKVADSKVAAILPQEKVANNRIAKNNTLQKVIDYLVQNYDGVATEDIDHAKVATDLQIHRTTVTRNIEKLQEVAKLNGHVNKELLVN